MVEELTGGCALKASASAMWLNPTLRPEML